MNHIEDYFPYDQADKGVCYLHRESNIPPGLSIERRLKVVRATLKQRKKHTRKTEPYKSQWLESITGLEKLSTHLEGLLN